MINIDIDPLLSLRKLEDILQIPEVILVTEFENEHVAKFLNQLQTGNNNKCQPVIPILIDSYGGSAYGVLTMISAILNVNKPVATIVTSKAMSAGAILFGFGTEGYRYMAPSATLMIHDVGTLIGGKVKEIEAKFDNVNDLNENTYKRLAKHVGHHKNYFLDLIDKQKRLDWYLDANESKKHNLANHLHVPKMNVKLNLEVDFK
jgi:ATP-dependent protease ClpP protease subunit